MSINRSMAAAVAAIAVGFGQDAAVRDTYLPWEGGAAYYGKWGGGLPRDPSFFPVTVWLQDPATAAEYKSIGVNLFVGLWRGPTEDQLKKLSDAGMPVLASLRPGALGSPNAGVIRGWTLQGKHKPSPAQIEAQVWQSIIHGSMGIGYFCHQFKPTEDPAAPLRDPETRKALARINRTIASLAPVLNSPPVANGVTAVSSNAASPVDTLLKRHGGNTYLFAAGARPGGKTMASFRFRRCGDLTAEVIGESRTIAVRGGAMEDSFADYQVHIYRLPFDPNRSLTVAAR